MNKPSSTKLIGFWTTHLRQESRRPQTVDNYANAVNQFATCYQTYYHEDLDPKQVIPDDIAEYKHFLLKERKLAPRTVNLALASLSSFFRWAVTKHYAPTNPTISIHAVRLPQRQPKALTIPQERCLRRTIIQGGNLRDLAIFELLTQAGLRVGELLALNREDITINDRSGRTTIRESKHGGTRTAPLNITVRQALTTYLESLPEELSPDHPLWQGIRGPLRTPSTINKLLTNYAARTPQLKDVPLTPHTLRHTFATRYLESNPGKFRQLADILGHASIETVMIYTQPTEDDLQESVERRAQVDE